MAAPPCMSDDGNPAVFVGTMLQTGDAVALCDECLVPWAAAMLAAMTGLDPMPFLQAVSDSEITPEEVAAAEEAGIFAAKEPEDEAPDPHPKSGRGSRASRAAGTATDHAETGAADSDGPTLHAA